MRVSFALAKGEGGIQRRPKKRRQRLFNVDHRIIVIVILLMVQTSQTIQTTTWDVKTPDKYWHQLPTSTGEFTRFLKLGAFSRQGFKDGMKFDSWNQIGREISPNYWIFEVGECIWWFDVTRENLEKLLMMLQEKMARMTEMSKIRKTWSWITTCWAWTRMRKQTTCGYQPLSMRWIWAWTFHAGPGAGKGVRYVADVRILIPKIGYNKKPTTHADMKPDKQEQDVGCHREMRSWRKREVFAASMFSHGFQHTAWHWRNPISSVVVSSLSCDFKLPDSNGPRVPAWNRRRTNFPPTFFSKDIRFPYHPPFCRQTPHPKNCLKIAILNILQIKANHQVIQSDIFIPLLEVT